MMRLLAKGTGALRRTARHGAGQRPREKPLASAGIMTSLSELHKRLVNVTGLLVLTLLIGTAGYVLIEAWTPFDALYMTVITLATVGYGETHPLSFAGRLFTVLLILGGVSIVAYTFSILTSTIVEGHLSVVLSRRRMEKQIAKLSGHYIVCGMSHSAQVIMEELGRTGRAFVVVEKDRETAEKLVAEGIKVVEGDATEEETLRRAGVMQAAGIFAVLASDQYNAFLALTAKGLNPGIRVVSTQRELTVRQQLLRSGADNVVNPQYIGGLRMVSEMVRPATVGFLDSMMRDKDSVFRFDEVAVPHGSPLVGRPVREVKGAGAHAPLLVAVHEQETGRYDINPDPARPVRPGDRLVMLGEASTLADLRKRIEDAPAS
jgi:voltage-gated potassium channel